MHMKLLKGDVDFIDIFSQTDEKVYLLLDGARFDNVHAFIYSLDDNPEYFSLYRKTYFESIPEISPCLVRLQSEESPFLRWYLEKGADKHEATLMVSKQNINALGEHFQNFLEAKLPNLNIVIFRFYDPEVFNALANVCSKPQIVSLLAPCEAVYWKMCDTYKCLLRSASKKSEGAGEQGEVNNV